MKSNQPLPEKMRPTTLDFFVGQEHIQERIRAFINAKHIPSLLFFGPPGCGKSTLAILLAKTKNAHYIRLSAPETGLQQLRRKLNDVDILILDEIHRFSKSQQDFFLPLIESGELRLIATTTENPSFSITKQLLSRLHVLRLNTLSINELNIIAQRTIKDQSIILENSVISLLVSSARGDARTLLNLLEYIVSIPQEQRHLDKVITNLPEFLSRHDKDGDNHYELASALIKSIRGSDPDASLYYLACLLEGGEDPRFICRRLILSASEDIGLADPDALSIAVACQQAVEFIGMPEGFIPLAETVVYLALAHKSNSTYAAYLLAKNEIKQNGQLKVPLHLCNAVTSLHKEWGYGKEYKYPHNYPQNWVSQNYLPQELIGKKFYQPGNNGNEIKLSQWWYKNSQKNGK